MPMLRVTTEVIEDDIPDVDLTSFKRGFLAARKGRDASFLIVRDVGWGDVLLVLTAMRSMYEYYKGIKLHLATSNGYRAIAERFPWVAGTVDIKKGYVNSNYDLVLDLREKFDYLPICREAHRLNLIHQLMRIPMLFKTIPLKAEAEDIEVAHSIMKDKGGHIEKAPVIGVHYASYADIRTWDWAEEFVQLCYEAKYNVITIQDKAVNIGKGSSIKGLTRTDGREVGVEGLVGLLSHCNVVVCPDSGVMHTAGMMGVPFVALFGSIPPELRDSYYGSKRSIFLKELPCTPCFDWQVHCCQNKPTYKKCLLDITPEAVLIQTESLLKEMKKEKVDEANSVPTST